MLRRSRLRLEQECLRGAVYTRSQPPTRRRPYRQPGCAWNRNGMRPFAF